MIEPYAVTRRIGSANLFDMRVENAGHHEVAA
jgi:hypothetical protein